MSIYTRNFHKKRIGHPRYPILAEASLEAHKTMNNGDIPRSVIDVGCSVGALLGIFPTIIDHHVDLYGIDYSLEAEDVVFDGNFYKLDLDTDSATHLQVRCDMVICQEVLEHVKPESTDNALRVLTDVSHVHHSSLILGAAHPGQKGKHHINCRTTEEWKDLAEQHGWIYSEEGTQAYKRVLKDHKMTRGCYIENTQCFYRR